MESGWSSQLSQKSLQEGHRRSRPKGGGQSEDTDPGRGDKAQKSSRGRSDQHMPRNERGAYGESIICARFVDVRMVFAVKSLMAGETSPSEVNLFLNPARP